MALVDGFLEQLAQHLRVNGDFGVQGRRLRDGEVVTVEQADSVAVAEQGREGGIWHRVDDTAVQVGLIKQAAVEERHFADQGMHAGA
ncbi:MAG: hypothetical protein OXM01_08965 [Gemmatimonadota bacterium]|nr:hypothetical protein [Gemmatimonadota bacterium]